MVGLAISAAPTAAGAAAATRPASGTLLTSSNLALTSSTGRKLTAQILAERFRDDDNDTDFSVVLSDRAGEDHQWQLQVDDSAFAYDASTGRGTVKLRPAEINPLGTVDLAITSRGAVTTHTCPNGDSWSRRDVTLRGTFRFASHSTAWGQVGSQNRPVTFAGSSEIQTDFGGGESCFFPSGNGTCRGDISWDGPFNSPAILVGEFARRHGRWNDLIAFDREHSLDKPANTVRDDFATAEIHAAPVLTSAIDGSTTLAIRAGHSGLITGSAVLNSVGPEVTKTSLCRGGSTKTWTASYTNGADPLTAHLDIGGTLRLRNDATGADFSRDSTAS
jgi:hypothetical protein